MYDILKCKNFLIGVLDELGNFKQKEVYISKCKSFLNFTAMNPNHFCLLILLMYLSNCEQISCLLLVLFTRNYLPNIVHDKGPAL